MATAAATSQFTGVDFLNLDSLLSEDERAVRDTVRTWVDENLIPVIGQAYIEGKFPKQLIPGMAELGLFGANLPEEYGCAGLNNVAYGLIMQELERGDSGIRSFASVQGALVMYPIHAFGSEEQKKKWLPLLAAGQEIGCFGLTEPDFGSNPAGMITTARETRDGWVLNGTKMWITNGSQATVSIIWAKTGDVKDPKSIRGFIVHLHSPATDRRPHRFRFRGFRGSTRWPGPVRSPHAASLQERPLPRHVRPIVRSAA
jgi:glutaryl-CoA dehydrogenase